MINSNQRIMTLVDIAVYTTDEEMPLREITKRSSKRMVRKLGVDPKEMPESCVTISKVVPTFDEESVYFDIKKMLVWYDLLKDKIDFSKEEEVQGEADDKISTSNEHEKPIPKKHEAHDRKLNLQKATTAKTKESLKNMTSIPFKRRKKSGATFYRQLLISLPGTLLSHSILI